MSSFSDDIALECEVVVEFPDGTTGTIIFPCGSVFDTQQLPNDDAVTIPQIPVKYQILRERAILKPCCWWQESALDPENLEPEDIDRIEPDTPSIFAYTVVSTPGEHDELGSEGDEVVGGWAHEDLPSFKIVPNIENATYAHTIELLNEVPDIITKCVQPDAEQWHQGQDGSPPCNGAKTECPFYTGPFFQYIADRDLRPGKPIIGQQVQELRSLTRDWTVVPNAEAVWSQVYESPYIWARDFDDLPVLLNQDEPPEQIEETGPITNLVRVKWLHATQDVELIVYPSTPGDPNDPDETPLDAETPPRFHTLVGNLSGSVRPPLDITFPPAISAGGDNLFWEGFTFDSMSSRNHRLYLAGITIPVTNVYIVNTNFISGFDGFFNDESDIPPDEDITEMILEMVEELGLQGNRLGFRVVTSTRSRFWEVPEGIDLIPNESNGLVAMVRSGRKWNFVPFVINYGFHQVEIIQTGFKGLVPVPQTQSLVTSISSINATEPITFKVISLGGEPTLAYAYHYYVFDRSASRFAFPSTAIDKPDQRYWKVTLEQFDVEGSAIEGDLRWSKLDNCNRYVIEILNPSIPAAAPAGLDRGWEPFSIKFTIIEEIEEDPDLDGGGSGSGTTIVQMQVVEEPGEIGRSIDGSLMPARFLIVEPVGGQNIPTPSKISTMSVDLEVYVAYKVGDGEGEDVFDLLYEEIPDTNVGNAGGVSVNAIGDNVELATTEIHGISIDGSSIYSNPSKHDMSYMIEIASPAGDIIGRKWIYGVAEMAHSWVRDVDIKYAWSANSVSQGLAPNYARATAQINKPEKVFTSMENPMGDSVLGTYTPRCGDHEGRWLFSTYDGCEQSKYYINTAGIIITSNIPTGVVWDERYRGPALQEPYSIMHHPASILNKCVFEWFFGTTTSVGATWAGLARLKGPISPLVNAFLYSQYRVKDWVLPQFGNKGRDHLRVYRTMHYREYIYAKGSSGRLKVGAGWMPAIPFIGSAGVFDDTKPRTIFDYSAENVNLPYLDYESFEGQGIALVAGSEDVDFPSTNSELVSYERMTFDDTYVIRRPGAVEPGIQWPFQGWYFNFKELDVMWAFPEPFSDVARNYTGDYVRGITFKKPVSEDGLPILDRWGRTIDVGPAEGEIDLLFTPSELNENGQLVEYAKLDIIPKLPLYFDQITGEIKTTNLAGDLAINGVTSIPEFLSILAQNDIEIPEVLPLFEPASTAEEETMPTLFEQLTEIAFYGNIITDVGYVYVYPLNGPGGDNLDDEDIIWEAFMCSIELTSINVKYLPTITVPVEETLEVESAYGVLVAYPSIHYVVRESLSGSTKDATDSQLGILGEATLVERFRYEAYSLEDLELDDPTKGEGYIGPVTLTCVFPVPVQISRIAWSYKLKPRTVGEVVGNVIAGPTIDPDISLRMEGNATIVLLQKPQFTLPGDGEDVLREFVFDSSDFDPTFISSITVEIGGRDDSTGLWVSPFEVSVEQTTPVLEYFRCLNPKYIISRGYGSEGQPLYQPSQRKYISHVTTTPDQPDVLETAGIAEFWQPGMASMEEVGTIGKIRRHYASEWLTYDTQKYLGGPLDSVVFADGDAELSEQRQGDILMDFLNTMVVQQPGMLFQYLNYVLLPQDKFDLELTGAVPLLEDQTVEFELEPYELEVGTLVAEATKDPGWQPAGFHACIPDMSQTVESCIVNLGIIGFGGQAIAPHSVYTSLSHDTCGPGGTGGRSAYALFEFGRITEKIVGGFVPSASATVGQAEAGFYDSWSIYLFNQTVENNIAASLQKNIDEAIKHRGRYRP